MVLVAGLALFFVSERSYWQSANRLAELSEMSQPLQALTQLERSLDAAEGALCG